MEKHDDIISAEIAEKQKLVDDLKAESKRAERELEIKKIEAGKLDLVKWRKVSKIPDLSVDFARIHIDRLKWAAVADNHVLDIEFFKEFEDRFKEDTWRYNISNREDLTPEFVKEFSDKLSMTRVTDAFVNNDEWISDNKDILDWDTVLRGRNFITADFIDKYSGYINMADIAYRITDLDLIQKYIDKSVWSAGHASLLSDEFVSENSDVIFMRHNSINDSLYKLVPRSDEYAQANLDKFDWNALSQKPLTKEFILKYKDKLILPVVFYTNILYENFIKEVCDLDVLREEMSNVSVHHRLFAEDVIKYEPK